MIVARILLNTGLNDYAVIMGYATMFALFADIGTSWIMIRDVARDHSLIDTYGGTFIIVRGSITIFVVLVSLVIANFMPYAQFIINCIYIAALSQLIFQFSNILSSIFQAFEKMEYIAYGMILQSATFFIIGLLLIDKNLGNMGVLGLVYANLISNIVLLAISVVWVRKRIQRFKLNLNVNIGKYLVLAGLPFGIAGFLNILYSYADRFILSILHFSDVANYTMPYTLVMSLTFVLTAYSTSIFPMFSKMFMTRADSVRYACGKSFKYLLILMVPICVGTTLLSDRIIYTIYGSSFSGSIPVLNILVWLLMFTVVTNIGFPLLTATHRERLNVYILGVSAISNIILNIILIPSYGAIGSSIAGLLTMGVFNSVFTLYFIRADIDFNQIVKPLIKIAISTAIMALTILLIPFNNIVLYIVAGAIVYFIALTLIGGFSRDDVDIAKKIIFGNDRKENALFNILYRFTGHS
jgi:O-antigen/teichoic acid export membrane protein